MRNHSIAIQGAVSSFHDLAARKYFGQDISLLECGSFREVCKQLRDNKADYGIIAIENRIAGSILLNYQLIESFQLHVTGETYLPVELHLLGKPGMQLSEVREIISHPMALGQCQEFLSGLDGVLVTEYKDTASCAKTVSDEYASGLAVIAGPAVARHYGLAVIRSLVSDVQQNYTRFCILSKGKNFVDDADKASVTIRTRNEPGRLHEVLSVLRNAGLNLTKIQSIPVIDDPHMYAFHLDIEFGDKTAFTATMDMLAGSLPYLRVLGLYKKDKPLSGKGERLNPHSGILQTAAHELN